MKALGERYEFGDSELQGGFFHIVELSHYEFNVLKEVLEKRDLTAEQIELEKWATGFCIEMEKLNLNTEVLHIIIRATRNVVQGDIDRNGFSVDGNNLLSFPEWRSAVIANYNRNPKKGYSKCPQLFFRNMGIKSRQALITALLQS